MSDWRSRAKKIEPEEPRAPEEPGQPEASSDWRARATPVEPPPTRLPEEPGAAESFLRASEHGLTSGFADELGALGQTGLQTLASMFPKGSLDWAGIENRYERPEGDALQTYRSARGENRDIYKRAEEAHPNIYLAGDIVGGMLQPSPEGKKEAAGKLLKKGFGKALGKAGSAGALSGGIDALGDSEADLTKGEYGKALFDTTLGSVLGGTIGSGGYLVGRGLQKPIAKLGKWMENRAARKAVQTLENNTNPLDKGKKALSPEVGLEALESGGIVPLGTMQGALERLQAAENVFGERYGDIVRRLKEIGVEGPDIDRLVKRMRDKADEVKPFTFNPAEEKVWLDAANRLEDIRLNPRTGKVQAKLPLDQGEALKRSAQADIDWSKIEQRPINVQKKAKAGMMREAIEESIDDAVNRSGRLLPALGKLGREFKPVKAKYGRLAQATDAAEKASNALARKAPPPGPVEVAADMAFTGLSGGVPSPNALRRLWNNVVRERGPSTNAALNYIASKGLAKVSERPGLYGAKVGGAVERAINPHIRDALWDLGSEGTPSSQSASSMPAAKDAFWAQFAPPPGGGTPIYETPEERRLRELRETLQGYAD